MSIAGDPSRKPLVWLAGEIKSPPFSPEARFRVGYLLKTLQEGELIPFPHSKPMPSIGKNCHELRLSDKSVIWRVMYRIDSDAIIIAEVFSKKTQKTPDSMVARCKQRLKQ